MKLLLVIDSLGPGGAQRQLASLAIGLGKRGHDVEFFVYHDQPFFLQQLESAGVKVHLWPKPWRFSRQPIKDLSRLISSGRYDGVLSFLAVPNLYCIVARRGISAPPPLVVSHRSSAVGNSLSWRDKLAMRHYQQADWVTTNSHHMRDFLERRLPSLAPRITTIYNGVDLSQFGYAAPHAPEQSLRILALGNISEGKDWQTLAQAIGLLREQHGTTAVVTFCGRNRQLTRSQQRYRRKLEQQLAAGNLDSQWDWRGEVTDVAAMLQKQDCLVHPSCEEGVPNAICEALAVGRPVFAADTLDNPRLVQHGKTGWLFPAHDANALAALLFEFQQQDRQQRLAMSRQARGFAEQVFDLNHYVDQYEELLSRLVAEQRA